MDHTEILASMKLKTTTGLNLSTRIAGSGIPFIWGHGLMFSMAAEDATRLKMLDITAIREKVKLIRYDARGHGDSQATYDPEDYTWPNLGRDMLDLATAVGAERCILGGASMGCGSAIYAALEAPERVAALVLALPPTAWELRPAQARKYRFLAMLSRLGLLGWLLPVLMRSQRLLPSFFLEDFPEADQILKQQMYTMHGRNKRVFPPLLEGAARSDLPPEETLRTIEIPTLILAWADDAVHPVSSAQRLHALLPNSELRIATTADEYQKLPQATLEFLMCIQDTEANERQPALLSAC